MRTNLDLSTVEPKLFKARVDLYLVKIYDPHLLSEKVQRLHQVIGLTRAAGPESESSNAENT